MSGKKHVGRLSPSLSRRPTDREPFVGLDACEKSVVATAPDPEGREAPETRRTRGEAEGVGAGVGRPATAKNLRAQGADGAGPRI
jgi:hypothetical protein